MNRLTLYYNCDLYEVIYNETSIHHIEKFIGESQIRRDISFDELPEKLQSLILTEIENDTD